MIQVAWTPNFGGENNNNKKTQTLSNIKTCPISQTFNVSVLLEALP